MTDIDRLKNTYERIAASESEVHWILGDQLVADVQAGYKLDDLVKLCEPIFKLGRTAIRNHHKTSTVFGSSEQRALELSWSMHRLASTACRVTRPDDFKLAHDWIDEASKGKMTYDMLGDAMAATKGKVHISEPVYLCKRVPAQIVDVIGDGLLTTRIILHMSAEDAVDIKRHTNVLLTMFVPAESEVAA